MGAVDLNLGASKLRTSGRSTSEIAGFLAGHGVDVTRMTCSNWRAGRTTPPENSRPCFAGAPFYIEPGDWDRPVDPPNLAASVATLAGTTPGPTGRAKMHGAPATGQGERSAATLAAELLARIEAWRAAAEREGTAGAAARFAALEGRAIERLAKLRGEATAPEGELVRSPQWARLRAQILEVVAEHPPTARKLLAVLEGNAHPQPSKGARP